MFVVYVFDLLLNFVTDLGNLGCDIVIVGKSSVVVVVTFVWLVRLRIWMEWFVLWLGCGGGSACIFDDMNHCFLEFLCVNRCDWFPANGFVS